MLYASKKHLGLFLSLAALVWLTLPAAASPLQQDEPGKKSLYRYAGTYVLPSGAYLEVEVDGKALAVHPGTAPAETVADVEDLEALRALDQEAESVLAGLVAGNTAALQAALPEHRRTKGAADIGRLFHTFIGAHGAVLDYRILGTVSHDAQRAWTLAQVDFKNGRELVRLTWHRGVLSTVQRGPLPATAKSPASVVRFRRANDVAPGIIAFNMRPDGSVSSLTIEGDHSTVIAYKLADAPAVAATK